MFTFSIIELKASDAIGEPFYVPVLYELIFVHSEKKGDGLGFRPNDRKTWHPHSYDKLYNLLMKT